MPQQKFTSFSAAKVANFGVVMAEMVAEMSDLRKEVKRLRNHVSVLSKRNHWLVEDGKSLAASSIASNASMSSGDEEVLWEESGVDVRDMRARVVGTVVGEKARRKAHGDGVLEPWCEQEAKEFSAECQVRDRYLGRVKWKVAEMDVAEVVAVREAEVEEVEALSVAEVEEERVSKPVVRMPSVKVVEEGKKKRRVGEMTEDEEEASLVRGKLIAQLGPRAICGGLMREVGSGSVFEGADPRIVAGGGSSTSAAVGLSWRPDARRQRPGEGGGYQLRQRVGTYGYGGRGVWSRRRGV